MGNKKITNNINYNKSSSINWFPEYWNFIEKTKLFDFWRNRYCKNKIYFSPHQEKCGGIGFYDASYESLKFPNDEYRYEQVEEEYLKRREELFKELSISQEMDKKRLLLLIETEEKAFEYYKAKIILKPIEDDVPSILKQSIWLIDEKERAFKETFSYLIEYDRKHLSPLTYPERKMDKEPLNITECYNWLIRENRLFGEKDKKFFDKNHKKIEFVDRFTLLNVEFKPKLLIDRHERNILRERKKNVSRSKNGEILKDGKMFERPDVFYSNELREESLNLQIKKFLDLDVHKYESDYQNDIKIFKTDGLSKSLKERNGNEIPHAPYVLLQKNIFDLLENSEMTTEKEIILKQLREFSKERIREEKEKTTKKLTHEEQKNQKLSLFYFFLKNNKLEKKELDEESKIKIAKKTLEKDGIVFFSEIDDNNEDNSDSDNQGEGKGKQALNIWDDAYHENTYAPDDDFDDKTRFNFFIRDKNGLKFNRKGLINKFVKNMEIVNKFKLSVKLKTKAIVSELKNRLIVDLKETKQAKVILNKDYNLEKELEFKNQLNSIKQKQENNLKMEEKIDNQQKFQAPKYKMF